jgi:hypothetical protein
MSPPVQMVDWYRVDAWPRMRRVLIAGPALLTLGGLVVAVSFATREPASVRELADIAGLFLVATGAAVTMAGMHRILRDDAYLSIRTDGVLFHAASVETFVAWDDLRLARWDAGLPAIHLERRGGDAIVVAHRFAAIEGPALAERIERARRRAAMGMEVV